MNEAVIGLIGAVVGGGLTAGSNFLVEWQRLRGAREHRQADEDRQHDQAARLVAEELFEIECVIDIAMEAHAWWPLGTTLPTERWDTYAPTIALGNNEVWSWASNAYDAVKRQNLEVAYHRERGDQPPWTQGTLYDLHILGVTVEEPTDGMRSAAGLHALRENRFDNDLTRYYRFGQMRLDFSERA